MSKHPVPDLLMVDAFCGAGGVTTGARASGICRVVAGINHDPVAIASHAANHPDTHHFIEDIRTMPLDGLTSALPPTVSFGKIEFLGFARMYPILKSQRRQSPESRQPDARCRVHPRCLRLRWACGLGLPQIGADALFSDLFQCCVR
ncbi:MAG: DNA cytosine methyltransferase [Haliscomenobacteraceae bacterium CHB4]|nr:DNA cytosine methyltransferase [Haliscomenobacteraceae bacterium CHB4]